MDDSTSARRGVPRPPQQAPTDPTSASAPSAQPPAADADAPYGLDAGDAGGSEDRPSVVADVEASLAGVRDLDPEEAVEAYRDLESSLRETLRTAGGEA